MAKKVLIVEDEPHIVESLRFILNREGFEVSTREDAESGLDALRVDRPDVMVLDAMLPGETGFDMIRRLRATDEFAGLPILMLTAKGQRRDREVAREVGADCFMTKPFSNAEVVAAVSALASGEPVEDEPS